MLEFGNHGSDTKCLPTFSQAEETLPREDRRVLPDFLSPRTFTDLVSVGLANVEICLSRDLRESFHENMAVSGAAA